MIYVFGAFLVIIAVKIAFEKEKEIHPENNPVLKLFRETHAGDEHLCRG